MRRTFLAVACFAVVAFLAFHASGQEAETGSAYGWLSLVPPLLAITLALVTKDVLLSLFLGVFGGSLILNSWDPFVAFARTIDQFIVEAMIKEDHPKILIFTTLLGGMVGLITKNGGTHGIVDRLSRYATDSRRGQIATWLMGVLIFFDDYANTLIVGPTMRPITDKLKISREKLAYIVDSTAAPVVCLFPISTWVGYELGLIGDAFRSIGFEASAYSAFVASIPYRFYPIFALVLGFTIAASRYDFGPMRLAERRARETGEVLAADARPIADYGTRETEPPEGAPRRAINAVLPLLTVIFVAIWGLYVTGVGSLADGGKTRESFASSGEWLREVFSAASSSQALMWASLLAIVVALFLALGQRILKVQDAMGAMVGGFKAMLMALVVLILAWSLSATCKGLGTAEYMVQLTEGIVAPGWLPAITFVLSAVIAFATGSSWGTMGIIEPLVIPICHSLTTQAGHAMGSDQYWTYMVASIASVLAGSVWGDHCSPISDTTILSSMATGCDHIAHVRTQIPYALTAGGLAIVLGSVLTAHGLPVWVAILLGTVLLVGIVKVRGSKAAAG